MSSSQIVDLILDLHGEFINPKVIARRQVTRLVDRLITRVGSELILNRKKEEMSGVDAQQETPAKLGGHHGSSHGGSKASTKNADKLGVVGSGGFKGLELASLVESKAAPNALD